MEVILLAGGLGTRLRSVVFDVPKPMAPVKGKPFIEHLMERWIVFGATHFILSVGYLHEKITQHFGEFYKGIPVSYTIETQPLGTGGALLLALSKLKTQSSCAVQNGDTFFDIDFKELLTFHQLRQSDFTLALRQIDKNTRYSTVEIDNTGKIINFLPPDNKEQVLINGGVYVVNPTAIKEPIRTCSLEEDILPGYLRKGASIYGASFEKEFVDIGVPECYYSASKSCLT